MWMLLASGEYRLHRKEYHGQSHDESVAKKDQVEELCTWKAVMEARLFRIVLISKLTCLSNHFCDF